MTVRQVGQMYVAEGSEVGKAQRDEAREKGKGCADAPAVDSLSMPQPLEPGDMTTMEWPSGPAPRWWVRK